MKLKTGYLKRSTKVKNPQPDSSIKKKTQINKIRNEREEVTKDITEVQRIMRDYYKQLCANKMDHLEEMDKFLVHSSETKPGRNRKDEWTNYKY